jgi:hypothetical protein
MALNAPAVGEILLLKNILNHTAPTNKVLHLFKNNVDHTDDSLTIDDLEECDEAGYESVELDGGDWTVENVANVVTASHPDVTFTFTEEASVYGCYITTTDNELLWLEKFDGAPFNLPSTGGNVVIGPNLGLN